jgi:CubicO group peptidase (beta-lactamase class C family)
MPELTLDALESRAFDAWEPIAPPADFIDRLVPVASPSKSRKPKSRGVPWFPMAAAAVLGLLGVGVFAIDSVAPSNRGGVAEAGLTSVGGPDRGTVEPDAEEGPAWAAPALPADFPTRIERYVDGYGENYGPAFRFHGTIMVVRDGEVLYGRGFGRSDLTPLSAGGSDRLNSPDTRFRIGSLTQQFTAVAILQLQEQGKLSIDDPVDKHLPRYYFPSGDTPLTIRHLLSHTSGLWNFTDDLTFELWKRHAQDRDEVVNRITSNGFHFTPGTDFEATNSNYLLLGHVVARVSGQSYGDYLQANILGPAGMTDTKFGDAYATGEQAQGYVFNEEEFLEPAQDIHLPIMGGAGALTSTPNDLARWHQTLDEGRLLNAENTRLMYTPVRKNYGLGWVTSRLFGRTVVSHPGGVDGFNAHLMRFIDDRTMVLAVANTEVIDCRRIANDVAAIAYGHEPEPRVEHHDIYMDPSIFERFEGKYELTGKTRRQYSKLIDKEQLDRLAEVHIDRDGDRLWMRVPGHGSKWMHPLAEDRFFFKDDAGTIAKFVGDEAPEWLVLERQGREFLLRRSR